VYGESKLAGERETLAAHSGALVLRIGLEGWRPVGRPGFVQWVIDGLARGEPRNIVTDWIHTPVFAANLAPIIERLWRIERTGILHVGAAEPASNWDMAMAAVDAFDLDASLLTPITSATLSLRAARPRNVALDTSDLRRGLGDVVWSLSAGAKAMRDEEAAVRALQAGLPQ
jgi:dTDP-4-dehydrorhamnose reductase